MGIKGVECVNVGNDDVSNPILRAINKYSEHPSIIAIKTNCESNAKHSFSTLPLQDILEVVYDIDVSKAIATQNIPTRIFKENIVILNEGTKECIFPSRLKLGDITPTHKKGDVTDKSNYRPISLLPAISKLFEKLYAAQISNCMDNYFSKYLWV